MTTVSAAWSSSINSSEVERYDRCAGVRFDSSRRVASQSSVISGSAVAERSRWMTSPSGWFFLHSSVNLAVSRRVTELARALESTCSNFICAPRHQDSSKLLDVQVIGLELSFSPRYFV